MSLARGQIKILSSKQSVLLMRVMWYLQPERVVVRKQDMCEEMSLKKGSKFRN